MRWAMVAFACAALLAALPAAARAAPLNGQLAAVADGSLVTVNPDGSGLRTLWTPQGAGEITDLAWSPDGNRLALSYAGRIVVFDVAARRGVAITDGDRDTSPGWSADGRQVGFVRRGLQAMRVPAEGGEAVAAPFTIPDGATAVAWAPDLANIAVVVPPVLRVGETDLVQANIVGTPAWAPDGDRIAYADAAGLHTVPAARGEPARVIGPPAGSPRWSPDGRSLAYAADGRLRTVPVTGGTPRVVLPAGVTAVDWQPCTPGVTAICESVSPPACAATALNVTTQADQPVDLPVAPCGDPAGRPLTLAIVRPPDNGTLVGLRYTPRPGFTGQDSVIYRFSNGVVESELIRVSIFVVPRPALPQPSAPAPTVQRAPFLNARATPRMDRRRRVRLRASCDQNCTVALRLTGRLRSRKRTLRGRVVRRSLASGRVVTLRLRLPRKPRGAFRTVWITGTVANAAGQQRRVKLPVTIRR